MSVGRSPVRAAGLPAATLSTIKPDCVPRPRPPDASVRTPSQPLHAGRRRFGDGAVHARMREKRARQAGKPGKLFRPLQSHRPRLPAEHAHRAEPVPVFVADRHADIGADALPPLDQFVRAEPRIGRRVLHDQRTWPPDRLVAETVVPPDLARRQAICAGRTARGARPRTTPPPSPGQSRTQRSAPADPGAPERPGRARCTSGPRPAAPPRAARGPAAAGPPSRRDHPDAALVHRPRRNSHSRYAHTSEFINSYEQHFLFKNR